ncbi:MAG TPA: crossover junction endodeoxyribonuclease RuvC [bacterium]|nr:crossover junction endodeoxyribonuclease RuvC [bacterium]
MIIAGIDPGLQNTGIAAIEKFDRTYQLMTCDRIETRTDVAFEIRLKTIYDKLTEFIECYLPDQIALEEIFYAQNAKVALKMGHARGVTLLAAANQGVPVSEYSAREIKLSVTGNGNASKHQVQQMICRILNINIASASYDVSDAMAVAYCHSQRLNNRR